MRKALIGLICLLVLTAVTVAATTTATQLKLKSGSALTNRINIPLVGTRNACTTQFIGWATQPYPTLAFGLYCKPEADTWLVNATYRWTGWPTADGPYDNKLDTVVAGCTVDGDADTLRTMQVHWCREFYPHVSQGGFFIIEATESLTDTLWVDSVVFDGYGD